MSDQEVWRGTGAYLDGKTAPTGSNFQHPVPRLDIRLLDNVSKLSDMQTGVLRRHT